MSPTYSYSTKSPTNSSQLLKIQQQSMSHFITFLVLVFLLKYYRVVKNKKKTIFGAKKAMRVANTSGDMWNRINFIKSIEFQRNLLVVDSARMAKGC